jgi:hypothetical protein
MKANFRRAENDTTVRPSGYGTSEPDANHCGGDGWHKRKEGKTMVNRGSMLKACGAFLGLVLIAGAMADLSAASRVNRLEHLTFSGPVGLPGVTLARGAYSFEVANPDSSADIIRVRRRVTNDVVFLGFTRRSERPKSMSEDRSMLLGEAPRGAAAPILGWYPVGEVVGHKFVYAENAR